MILLHFMPLNRLFDSKEKNHLFNSDFPFYPILDQQVSSLRDCAVYISNLPSNVSAGKLEGDLDAEADCNVKEVCIMKVRWMENRACFTKQ